MWNLWPLSHVIAGKSSRLCYLVVTNERKEVGLWRYKWVNTGIDQNGKGRNGGKHVEVDRKKEISSHLCCGQCGETERGCELGVSIYVECVPPHRIQQIVY